MALMGGAALLVYTLTFLHTHILTSLQYLIYFLFLHGSRALMELGRLSVKALRSHSVIDTTLGRAPLYE